MRLSHFFDLGLITCMNSYTHTSRRPTCDGMTTPESLLTRKLAGYLAGVAGTAAMLAAPQAQAAVIYTDNLDIFAPVGFGFTFEPGTGLIGGAVNGQTVPTSGFTVWNYGLPYTNYIQLTGDAKNPAVGTLAGPNAASNLALGTTIGSASVFAGSGAYPYFMYFDKSNAAGFPWNTELDGTTGYVGLKFEMGANTHYGWARFTYDDLTTGNITLHDFAYENVAGQSILAGDTGPAAHVPEPSRALLALAGLCGVALRRRRKQAA